jgi:hypothetical protein
VLVSGATFSFLGVTARVLSVAVEHPKAETVNMTGFSDPTGAIVLVPTGEWSGGTVSVEFVGRNSFAGLVRQFGQVSFSSGAVGFSFNVILESCSTEIRVGESLRGTLRFITTDYYG